MARKAHKAQPTRKQKQAGRNDRIRNLNAFMQKYLTSHSAQSSLSRAASYTLTKGEDDRLNMADGSRVSFKHNSLAHAFKEAANG